jgi:gliding motility-associated-like protein
VGYTRSLPGNDFDIFLVKLNSSGALQWSRSIGGTWLDEGYSLVQTYDGGYAIAGYTGQVPPAKEDAYVVKLDSKGALQWSVTIGTPDIDYAYSITQTKDSGYAVVGYSTIVGVGPFQGFVVKLNNAGALQWSKRIAPNGDDIPYSIRQTIDGGYVIGGNKSGNSNHNIFKLNSLGGGCCESNTSIQINPVASVSKSITSTDTTGGIVASGGVVDTGGIIIYKCLNGCAKPIANAGQNITICMGNTTILNASWAGNYNWIPSVGLSNNTVQNPQASPTTTTTYSLVVTNSCSSDTNAVTVHVVPSHFSSISGNSVICSGESTVLTATGGSAYLWNTGESSSAITVNTTVNTTYSVVVSNGFCSNDTSISITVFQNPIAATSANTTIFQGQTTTLSASGGATYLWSNGETTTLISVTPPVTTIYCVIVTDTNNCKDTSCATVSIESPCDTAGTFFFPNAFSPNGDGENDFLKIYYNEMSCISTLHLIIYDRWGEKIYETADPYFSWDGTYPNKTLNSQVLAYHLSVGFIDSKVINRKGNISLLR